MGDGNMVVNEIEGAQAACRASSRSRVETGNEQSMPGAPKGVALLVSDLLARDGVAVGFRDVGLAI
jgi:hypothetical protein